MDPRDFAIQAVTPTLVVPKFGAIEVMKNAGHRFLVAKDGLWIQVKRAWLDLCMPLALQSEVAMPYGNLETKLYFVFGKLPLVLLDEFIQNARTFSPNECGAWIVWNENTGDMDLRMLQPIEAGIGHLSYHCPVLGDGEHLIVDIHSHGNIKAFFSSTDDADDANEVKVAVVVGSLDREKPTLAMRICANGLFIALPTGKKEHNENESEVDYAAYG